MLEVGDEWRDVNVSISYNGGLLFPHPGREAGETTGDHELDRTIRMRAAEELARQGRATSHTWYSARWPEPVV